MSGLLFLCAISMSPVCHKHVWVTVHWAPVCHKHVCVTVHWAPVCHKHVWVTVHWAPVCHKHVWVRKPTYPQARSGVLFSGAMRNLAASDCCGAAQFTPPARSLLGEAQVKRWVGDALIKCMWCACHSHVVFTVSERVQGCMGNSGPRRMLHAGETHGGTARPEWDEGPVA